MSKIFKELVCYFMMIAINKLKGFTFTERKNKDPRCSCNENGEEKGKAKIICRSFLQG